MPTQPMKVQLVIQGGGAKIYALIAAVEALQERQGKDFVITKIAGTSAGAIVGCFLAAGISMKSIRQRLRGMSKRKIKQLFPDISLPRAIWSLSRGLPLWDTAQLEKFLNEQLQNAGNFTKLSQIKSEKLIEVKIIAANLTDSTKVVHCGDEPIVSSLLNSCGLPYYFRVWGNSGSSVIVDGGICENLPFEELSSDTNEFGPILAISFAKPQRRAVNNVVEFSKALLDTAMENSMERSRMRLGDASVFSIPALKVGTFDFSDAHHEICSDGGSYELIREQARSFFQDFLDRHRKRNQVLVGDPWKTQSLATMEQLGKVYQAQHSQIKRRYSYGKLIVKANCLYPQDHPSHGPDLVHYQAEFKTLNQPMYCHRIFVSDAKHATSLERTTWTVLDLSTNKQIRAIDVPMITSDSATEDTGRQLLLFLDPVLPANSGPYRFDFQDMVEGFMKPLAECGEDKLKIVLKGAEQVIEKIELLLWAPNGFLAKLSPHPESIAPGRAMLPFELSCHPAPPGFSTFGWIGENIPAGGPFAVKISL